MVWQREIEETAADGRAGGRTVAAVIAFIALVLALLVGGTAYLLWAEHRQALAQAETRAADAVRTASEHARWLVEAGRQALHRIGDALADDPGAVAFGELRDLQSILRALPGDSAISVFDAEGYAVLTTDAGGLAGAAPVNVADRDYFRAHAGGAEWHIGRMVTGRASGRRIFTISRRLERGGAFAGVAAVAVPVELMSAFYASLGLGGTSSVALVREDGWLVARHPVPAEAIDLGRHPLFTQHLPRAPAGVYRSSVSPADGVARIVAYRRVPDLPLVAVVGIAREAALSGYRARLAAFGAIVLPVLLVLLFAAGWIVLLLRRDERTRRALAAALRQNRMLLREVHHRVKNNLQIVASLVNLQPGPPEGKAEMMRRISAIAAVHEQIYLADRFDSICLAAYLERLAEAVREAFASPVAVSCDLAPLAVDIETAMPLGLIASEVLSNAFKHAFPAGRAGRIRLSLRGEPGGEAVLRIVDDGIGLPPTRSGGGIGLKLIDGLCT